MPPPQDAEHSEFISLRRAARILRHRAAPAAAVAPDDDLDRAFRIAIEQTIAKCEEVAGLKEVPRLKSTIPHKSTQPRANSAAEAASPTSVLLSVSSIDASFTSSFLLRDEPKAAPANGSGNQASRVEAHLRNLLSDVSTTRVSTATPSQRKSSLKPRALSPTSLVNSRAPSWAANQADALSPVVQVIPVPRSCSFVATQPTDAANPPHEESPPAISDVLKSPLAKKRGPKAMPLGMAAILAQIQRDGHNTYIELANAFKRRGVDLATLRAARIVAIENESIRSVAEQQVASRRHPATAAPHDAKDFHAFASHNALREAIANTTPNRFGLADHAMKGLSDDEIKKLMSHRNELRRGFSTKGFAFKGSSPMAITFEPLMPAGEVDSITQATKSQRIAGVRVKCMLVGTLVHVGPEAAEKMLESADPAATREPKEHQRHHPWHPLQLPLTTTTVTPKMIFEQSRRQEMRAKIDKSRPKLKLWQKMIIYGDRDEFAKAMEMKRVEEEYAALRDAMLSPASGMTAASDGHHDWDDCDVAVIGAETLSTTLVSNLSKTVLIDGFLQNANAPSLTRPRGKSTTAAAAGSSHALKELVGDGDDDADTLAQLQTRIEELPEHLCDALHEKHLHDSRPLREHAAYQGQRFSDFVPYRECTFVAQHLVTCEIANVDPANNRPDFASNISRHHHMSAASRQSAAVFTPLEFTTRWSSAIEDVHEQFATDCWVRKWVTFPSAVFGGEGTPLPQLLAICKRGSVSVDVQDSASTIQYRHSFVFSNEYM